jgi:VanZ family protein
MFIPWVFLLGSIAGFGTGVNAGKVILLVAAGIAFAVAHEGIQYLLPYRSFNINDLLANGLGVLIGAPVLFFRKAFVSGGKK